MADVLLVAAETFEQRVVQQQELILSLEAQAVKVMQVTWPKTVLACPRFIFALDKCHRASFAHVCCIFHAPPSPGAPSFRI